MAARDETFRVRVSSAELAALKQRAEEAGYSLSEWARRELLGDDVSEDGRVAEGRRRRGSRVVVRGATSDRSAPSVSVGDAQLEPGRDDS